MLHGATAKAVEHELCFEDAHRLVAMLRARTVSSVEVLQAFLAQIERLNPLVNAVPTLLPQSELLQAARAADRETERGAPLGPLHGLPLAIKDVTKTRGIRTTFGSRIYADFCQQRTSFMWSAAGGRARSSSARPTRRSSAPARRPSTRCSARPATHTISRGPAAAAAAARQRRLLAEWFRSRTARDLGGSLRNPASFCNVVGFRPSPGRVPRLEARAGDTLGVYGPMGRTVRDVACLLAVMAGPDARDPLSLAAPQEDFRRDLDRDFRGTRVAWSATLGGYPVESAVTAVCSAACSTLLELDCELAEAEPDLSGVDEIFQTLRAAGFAAAYREDYVRHRHLMKDTVAWNIERGLALAPADIERASADLAALRVRTAEFFARYDFLVLPVSQVAPFPVEVEWVREIEGVRMETYIDWMATCYAITCTGLPAISIPCGFTAAGLPIGLQIVGAPQRDFAVLQLARAFELATQHARRRPPIAIAAPSNVVENEGG